MYLCISEPVAWKYNITKHNRQQCNVSIELLYRILWFVDFVFVGFFHYR